jgi:hypothetical protein
MKKVSNSVVPKSKVLEQPSWVSYSEDSPLSYGKNRYCTTTTTKSSNISTSAGLDSESTLAQNYFGEIARLKFFERYRSLQYQSQISLVHRQQPLQRIYFEGDRPRLPNDDDNDEPTQHSRQHDESKGFGGMLADDELGDGNHVNFFLTSPVDDLPPSGKEGRRLSQPRQTLDKRGRVWSVDLEADDDDGDLIPGIDDDNHHILPSTVGSPLADGETSALFPFERSQTDSGLIKSHGEAAQVDRRKPHLRPQTAPNRQQPQSNRSLSPLNHAPVDFPTYTDGQFIAEEKLPLQHKPKPKPVSARSSGRKIYKFQKEEEVDDSTNNQLQLQHQNSSLLNASVISSLPPRPMSSMGGPSYSLIRSASATTTTKFPRPQSSAAIQRYSFSSKKKSPSDRKSKKKKEKSSTSLVPFSPSIVADNSSKEKDLTLHLPPFSPNANQHRISSCSNNSLGMGSLGQDTTTTATSELLHLFNGTLNNSEDFTDFSVTSPRTKFIVNCINDGMNPRASLLLR